VIAPVPVCAVNPSIKQRSGGDVDVTNVTVPTAVNTILFVVVFTENVPTDDIPDIALSPEMMVVSV
jgi:hypothetical protein